MILGEPEQGRAFLPAPVHGVGATAREGTARRQVNQVRYDAGDFLQRLLAGAELLTEARNGLQQPLSIGMGWILEDNDGMRNIIETIGGQAYKRYRIYEKEL